MKLKRRQNNVAYWISFRFNLMFVSCWTLHFSDCHADMFWEWKAFCRLAMSCFNSRSNPRFIISVERYFLLWENSINSFIQIFREGECQTVRWQILANLQSSVKNIFQMANICILSCWSNLHEYLHHSKWDAKAASPFWHWVANLVQIWFFILWRLT